MCFPLAVLFAFLGLLAEKGHMARWDFFRGLPCLSFYCQHLSPRYLVQYLCLLSCWTERCRQGEPLCVFPFHHWPGGLVGGRQPLWSEWCSGMGQGGRQAEVSETGTVTSLAMSSAKDRRNMGMETYCSKVTSLSWIHPRGYRKVAMGRCQGAQCPSLELGAQNS